MGMELLMEFSGPHGHFVHAAATPPPAERATLNLPAGARSESRRIPRVTDSCVVIPRIPPLVPAAPGAQATLLQGAASTGACARMWVRSGNVPPVFTVLTGPIVA